MDDPQREATPSEKYRLLLARFPRADGDQWRAVEICEATGGLVSQAYASALAKGRPKKRADREKLGYIADVMGFPLRLWDLEPEEWDDYLQENPARGSIRSLHGRELPRLPKLSECGQGQASYLNQIIAVLEHPGVQVTYRGRPLTLASRRWAAAGLRLPSLFE